MTKGRNYTTKEDEYIREHYGIQTVGEIAKHLNRDKRAVYNHIYQMRKKGLMALYNTAEEKEGSEEHRTRLRTLCMTKRGNYTPKENEYIREHYGIQTVKEIAEHLNRSKYSVYSRISRMTGLEDYKKLQAPYTKVSTGEAVKDSAEYRIKLRYRPIEYKRQDVSVPGFEVGVNVKAKVDGVFESHEMRKGVIVFKNDYFIVVDFGIYRQSYLWHYVKRGDVIRI